MPQRREPRWDEPPSAESPVYQRAKSPRPVASAVATTHYDLSKSHVVNPERDGTGKDAGAKSDSREYQDTSGVWNKSISEKAVGLPSNDPDHTGRGTDVRGFVRRPLPPVFPLRWM